MYVDYSEVGRRIAKRRRELGYKQAEVNEMANLSDKYLSNIERGKSVMSIDVLMKICTVLEINPDYLLLGSIENKTVIDYEKSFMLKLNTMSEDKIELVFNFIDWLSTKNL